VDKIMNKKGGKAKGNISTKKKEGDGEMKAKNILKGWRQ